jgi:AcrR family transcriptional regulator
LASSSPTRTGSELRSDARRNQRRILRAAARLLAADRTATTQQIADAAEVGRQTVYRRYPTREALVEAIVAEALAEFSATLGQVASRSACGAEAVEQLIRSLARISSDYPILLSGPDDAHETDESPDHTTADDRAVLVEQFDAQIARGQRDGSIRTDLAPGVVRHSLFGALSMSLKLIQQQPEHNRPSPDSIGEQVTSLIMDGLRPRTHPRSRPRPPQTDSKPAEQPNATRRTKRSDKPAS